MERNPDRMLRQPSYMTYMVEKHGVKYKDIRDIIRQMSPGYFVLNVLSTECIWV